MIDVYKYTKDIYKHVPNGHDSTVYEFMQIYEKKQRFAL